MRRFATALILVALIILPCSASADHVGIYNDTSGSQCFLEISPPVPVSVYVVHIYTLGTRGSSFKIEDVTGMVPVDVVPLDGALIVGNVYNGAEVAYNDCYFGHFALVRLDFFAVNPPNPECGSKLRVLSYPGRDSPIVVDCALTPKAATGGEFAFGPWYCSGCSANSSQQQSWGRIKALYR